MPKKYYMRLRDKPNKSAFIAEAVREKLDAEDKTRRQEELALAYRAASREEQSLAEEWDAVSGDSA